MRSAVVRPDGTLELSKMDRSKADISRYLQFRKGKSFIDIAEAEGINTELAKQSVRRGRQMYEAEQLLELRDLKHVGLIEVEKLRHVIRARIAHQLVDSIETLLKGERTIVEVNKITGEVTLHQIVDPEIIAMGIEQARKSISLEERPAVNQTTVNIQQNNMAGEGSAAGGDLSYEDRLARVRARQQGQRLIEAEVSPSGPEPPIEAELIEPEKPEGEWGF